MAQAFEADGYKKVYVLKGGWMPWLMAHYPTEKKEGAVATKPAGGSERQLIGRISPQEMYSGGPEYKQDADAYPANPDITGQIKKIAKKTTVLVFMAWWCGDSSEQVPKFMKVLDAAANPNLTVEIFSVDKQLQDGGAGLTAKYSVVNIPTFVFLRNDAEIGRIVENPKKTMEEDILAILKSGR